VDFVTWKAATTTLIGLNRTDVEMEDIPGDVLYDAFLHKVSPEDFASQSVIPRKSSVPVDAQGHPLATFQSADEFDSRRALLMGVVGVGLLLVVVSGAWLSLGRRSPPRQATQGGDAAAAQQSTGAADTARLMPGGHVGGGFKHPVSSPPTQASGGDSQPGTVLASTSPPAIGGFEIQPVSSDSNGWRLGAVWTSTDTRSVELTVNGQSVPVPQTADGIATLSGIQDGDTIVLTVRNSVGQAQSTRTFMAPQVPQGAGAGNGPGAGGGTTGGVTDASTTGGGPTDSGDSGGDSGTADSGGGNGGGG
jgi:hypothetical protein